MLETVQVAHLPSTLPLYIALYHSLHNASYLRQQLLAGNSEYEYAFIDAKMILSRTHLLAACFRAVNDYLNGRLKSRNVHSEIVFALSGNNNIGEAFQRFGIQPSTTGLLVVKVGTNLAQTSREAVEKHLLDSVEGIMGSFDDQALARVCDVERLRKVYKIAAPTKAGSKRGKEPVVGVDQYTAAGSGEGWKLDDKERPALERAVLGAIALRGAT